MSERSGELVSPSRLLLHSEPAAALHQTIMGLLAETHDAAREAYNLMFKKGWYKPASAKGQHRTRENIA